MKKIYIRLLLWLFVVSAGMVSCIHDDTTGFVNEIPELSIVKVKGEGVNEEGKKAYAEFMMPVHFEAEVNHSENEVVYEWKVGYVNEWKDGKPVMDSLYLVSEKPVLEHSFNRVGEFLVRLRVSDGFSSAFYYMMVEIKAGMERGLLVLSSDDAGKGRLSFCSVLEDANELLKAKKEDFDWEVWSRINPDYELVDALDMSLMDFGKYKNSVFVISKFNRCVYELEPNTLLVLRKIDLTLLVSELNIQPVALSPCRDELVVLSENGIVVGSQLTSNGLMSDAWGAKMKGTKMYQAVIWNDNDKVTQSMPVVAEDEKLVCYTNLLGKASLDSGTDFEGRRIVNFLIVGNTNLKKSLLVVSQSKNDPGKVWVTNYVSGIEALWNMEVIFGHESGEEKWSDKSYELSAPLTLTEESDMLYNTKYSNSIFYNSGNSIYRWRHGSDISEVELVTTVPGEITCMAQSPDEEYLYVGTYDPAATGLKGSVYIYKTENLQLVNSFVGVADKPLKLFYKDTK
ncbi:PKD domain-containing protein [Butyricimonas hominis]|uniref:PKD domain-containing protein n=1 Tax=Butyricimonas hominis TaxID=2763032 RepID=UPI00351606C5